MKGTGVFVFQAEDGIRVLVRSRRLGDVYKRQIHQMWSPTRFCSAYVQSSSRPAISCASAIASSTDLEDIRQHVQGRDDLVGFQPEKAHALLERCRIPVIQHESGKELLRKGVTVTPAFGGANFIRDSWVRAVLDPNASPSAIYNLAKGVANDWRAAKEVVEMTPFYVALQQAGAGGAGLIKSNMKKNTAAMLTKKAAAKSTKPDRIIISFANMVKHPFKTMENVNSIAEQLNRFQAAEAVFKKTGDIKKAAAVFNEVSTNFNEMGAAVRVINRYVPFFGASIGLSLIHI